MKSRLDSVYEITEDNWSVSVIDYEDVLYPSASEKRYQCIIIEGLTEEKKEIFYKIEAPKYQTTPGYQTKSSDFRVTQFSLMSDLMTVTTLSNASLKTFICSSAKIKDVLTQLRSGIYLSKEDYAESWIMQIMCDFGMKDNRHFDTDGGVNSSTFFYEMKARYQQNMPNIGKILSLLCCYGCCALGIWLLFRITRTAATNINTQSEDATLKMINNTFTPKM